MVREGLRKILDEYKDPPAEGAMVPRPWVEENILGRTPASQD